jgi:type IV secretory pathway TraG/TraD family ATPase VirD4
MVLSSQEKNSIEKVTLLLPQLLKEEVMQLKESLQVSMNSIYQMAIAEYVAKKKREQLRQEALMMVDEYNTNPEILELIDFEEDLNEY